MLIVQAKEGSRRCYNCKVFHGVSGIVEVGSNWFLRLHLDIRSMAIEVDVLGVLCLTNILLNCCISCT